MVVHPSHSFSITTFVRAIGKPLVPQNPFSLPQSVFSSLLPVLLYLPRAASIYGAEKLQQGLYDTKCMTIQHRLSYNSTVFMCLLL